MGMKLRVSGRKGRCNAVQREMYSVKIGSTRRHKRALTAMKKENWTQTPQQMKKIPTNANKQTNKQIDISTGTSAER